MFEGIEIEEGVSLAPFTTFKIGGPAKYFFRAKTRKDLEAVLREASKNNIPIFILGGGSNILIHDKGFDGLAIKMELNDISIKDTSLVAGAGVLLNAAIMRAVKEGLSGLEFATGIPAKVGGAVWANLGSRGSDMSKVVASVIATDMQGNERVFSHADCKFEYRHTIFKDEPWVIIEAKFNLHPRSTQELRQAMVDLAKLKKEEQDVGEDTAGCAFRNPHDHEHAAAKLIDDLGLKGFAIGGAQVSEKHANFILNKGGATADDVVQLISYIKQQVRDKKGVQLMEEIEYVGF
ncbi:MAG: UDP-N-acetylmuramate dehydrogenase [bacterium]|nr:UDP-N-acetylmuramate dehydrogenase [bacterium]